MTPIVAALPENTPARFLLLDRLDNCDGTKATARRAFTSAPAWQGLEAMAQLAALHARWTVDFNLHAFLLTVEECTWPTAADLHGTLYIRAGLLAQSDRAATYATVIAPLSPSSGGDSAPAPPCMAATLTIGHTPYDTRFNGHTLTARYREIFAWLTRTA